MQRIELPHWLLGGLAVGLGLMVYLTDRDPSHAVLIPAVASLRGHPAFGAVGDWLPSFVHPLAFSLFTAAVVPHVLRPAYWACALWGGVNVGFEIGQHPAVSAPLAAALRATFGSQPPAEWLANYFVRGSFDVRDLAAAVAGSVVAALALRCMHRPLEVRYAH